MFNIISGQYDQFNDLMSWGMARIWRKKSLLALAVYHPKQILDIAAGTADMCIKAHQYISPDYVTGIDISDKMLNIGREKVEKAKLTSKIDLQVQDCASLAFADGTFDAVTIAFGIRNFEKLSQSLQQINRVLKSNGHLLILEMNEPSEGILLKAYQLYIKLYVGVTAKFLSADKKAYDYLIASMHAFPSGEKLITILNENGFKLNTYRKFTCGVCSMYLVEKIN
jgi:demethylmenaquinone methyltransferase/2-methoxy-6-polyprenyl-1,4-benzoquinol methylase